MRRRCQERTRNGEPCRQAPLVEGDRCYWHDPANAEEAQQARKLGGQRRKRESTLAGAYEIGALDDVDGIRRLLEIIVYDGLSMENSIARGRMLISAAQSLTALLKVGEFEAQLAEVLAVLKPRLEARKKQR